MIWIFYVAFIGIYILFYSDNFMNTEAINLWYAFYNIIQWAPD